MNILGTPIEKDFWQIIKETENPIVLYGTGNGADRIIDEFAKRNIPISGIFASDNFVRDRFFRGFKVLSYSVAKQTFGKMTVILGFGTHDTEVIKNILKIASENELYMPDLLEDENGSLFDLSYYDKHASDIEYTYSILEDELSRLSFSSVIKYRLTGKLDYLLDKQEKEVQSWSLLNIGQNESFVDCGAYNGDTIVRFCSFTEKWNNIYAFEPDVKTFKKLQKNTEHIKNIELYNAAVADKLGTMFFSIGKGRGTKQGGNIEVPSLSIDKVLDGREATILKFDTEGFEEKALYGCQETIRKFHPRMVLSAYHKIDDLWVLPKIVLSFDKNYKFYLRKAPCIPYWDTNYYIV